MKDWYVTDVRLREMRAGVKTFRRYLMMIEPANQRERSRQWLDDIDRILREVENRRDVAEIPAWRMTKPLNEGDEVAYVGVYALKWRPEWGMPEVGFFEASADEMDSVDSQVER